MTKQNMTIKKKPSVKKALSLSRAGKLHRQHLLKAKDMFRGLVVVPRSHRDGTHELLRPPQDHVPLVNNKLQFSFAHLPKDKQSTIAKRAVALDVRGQFQSVWVIWDARTLHQGHLFVDGVPQNNRKFAPTLVKPVIFAPAAVHDWKEHLDKHGYAAVGPVLTEADVDLAATLLVQDVETITGIKRELSEVTDDHLPNHANTGLRHRGLPHGEFAWFLRTHPAVVSLWKRLFNGQHIVGVPACVALSPPRYDISEMKGSMKNYFTENWLHLDYSPPLPERMYQSTLYIFPKELDAAPWSRIGIMTCMAPSLVVPDSAKMSLLAGAILGAAGKAPAGLKFGHLQKIGEGYGTKGVSVLKPLLHPGLTDSRVCALTGGKYSSLKALQACSLGQRCEIEKIKALCSLGAATLKKLAHPRAVQLIYGDVG